MRLSRTRVLLRAALLVIGGAYMAWRAWGSWRSAGALPGGVGVLASRLAGVFALVGLLALLAAGLALSSLRPRRRSPSLRLGGTRPPAGTPREGTRESPGAGEAPRLGRPP